MTWVFFWGAFAIVAGSYVGYPLWLAMLKLVRPRPVTKAEALSPWPFVSVVVAACNEEAKVAGRLANLLEQDYPTDRLEIILVSDGSTDATVAVAQEVAEKAETEVKVLVIPERQGKPCALNEGVSHARGEIIVFADARQRFEKDTVCHLVRNFADQQVGCVSGELVFCKDSDSSIRAEMGAYWAYEKWIRRAESATGSVVGATGAVYAVRRALYQPLPAETLLDDVLVPLFVARQGYRVIFDRQAVACDVVSSDASGEWRRKVRTLAGNWQLLGLFPGLLNPLRNPLALRFIGHKFSRLLVPFALPLLLLSSFMVGHPLAAILGWVQVFFYACALMATLWQPCRKVRICNLSFFFCLLNVAALAGLVRWLTQKPENIRFSWGRASAEN